ncbi:hypothetical protein N7537_011915 [Penicillium hordei]|uniref:Uncharacterized protein n=1 Tax=Penicillium hordei TaxID=40994 RepID=A0AAD6DMT3_9EURO|nr:uncharacterized protein N7537_011915 [Penicillium hordei]KAJ5589237.1 hypothetical protein N7537_011915 [Penicillium hordei]
MEFESDEQLPTFEPYVATSFDHSMPRIHLAAFLTFSLDEPSKAVPILENGVERLIKCLTFLTGNVAFSTRVPGKENVFEIQPPTKQFLLQYPIFRIKYHEQPIFSGYSRHVVAQDIFLNEDIIPIPYALAEDYPSPVFRFQANVMPDGIILCYNFHHTALDGIGVAVVMDALAALCRSPNAGPEIIRTNPLKEQESRLKIFEAASTLSIKGCPQNEDLLSPCEPTSSSIPSIPVSRKFVLDTDKIAKLRTECATILKNQSNPHASKISSNTILTAVIWLCTIRAIIKTEPRPMPTKSCAVLVTEARSKLRPKLPLSYIGNAVILHDVYTPLEAVISSAIGSNNNTHITPRLDHDDIKLLAELASLVHTALGSVTDETIRELISASAASDNWAANNRPRDLIVSSLRSFPTYHLDFGPVLGPVRDFDMPEHRVPGQAWIMPARYRGRSSPWEVRLTLEPAVMGNVEKDRLMMWLGPREVSKV